MKKPDKIFSVVIEFIDYEVHIAACQDPEHYRNVTLLKKRPDLGLVLDKEWEAIHSFDNSYPRRSWIVMARSASPGVILHELTHVVDRIIQYFGFEGTEIRAYLLEYLFDKTICQLK